jgi:trehalose 2-sulfotransferase
MHVASRAPPGVDSYLICATPRTGSSLLCGLLESTGVAGHPESYFRQPDEQAWATRWGIAGPSEDGFSHGDYVRAALAAGRTENGIFAGRIMWGTLDEVVGKLATVYPDLAGRDVELLRRAFGDTRYVYLRRADVVAQAVSWLRAEQTSAWFETVQAAHKLPEQEPHFDFDQIHGLISLISEHNAGWQEWFALTGIHPYPVLYEELAAGPVAVTRGILDFLGIELPAGQDIVAQHRRLADALNTRWIDRYCAQALGSRIEASGGLGMDPRIHPA